MGQRQQTFAGVAALVCGLFAGAAFGDAVLPNEVLARLSPAERAAYVNGQIARQKANRSAGAAAVMDVSPAALTMVNAGAQLDLRTAQPSFKVSLKGTDDLSGISYIGISAVGPSGQVLYGNASTTFPTKNISTSASLSIGTRLLEPGVWTIDSAYATDAAGNYVSYDRAAVATLGNNTFTVVNNAGYDVVPPLLIGGEILTPSTSLSSYAAGTMTAPYIGMSVEVSDAGNTAVAGVTSVSATLCLVNDPARCLYLTYSTSVGGRASARVTLGGQAFNDAVLGDYELRSVSVADFAGNYSTLTSVLFGGSTDFSTMFAATQIKLMP